MINSQNSMSIMSWNVAGELHMPKYITSGSNSPRFVQKAAFYLSPSLILILLYPHRMSSLVKYRAPCTLLISSWINGKGYLFFIIALLSQR